jgi:SAM-dependent methyltransferase
LCVLDSDRVEERAMAIARGLRLQPERAPGDSPLLDTRAAFDGVAADYHRDNEDNVILRRMRRRVVAEIGRRLRAGDRLLDLGCGPGTDAEVFGRAGHHVTAVDWSPAMVHEATQRIERAGLERRVVVRQLGIQDLVALPPQPFDVAYSNFGALNCVPDLRAAARAIAQRLRPGGLLVASVIGRICPWEIAIFISRREWARARVRFSRAPVPVPLNGRTVWTQYYTPRECRRIFEPARLRVVSLRGLGVFVPPPYADAFASRHPALMKVLERCEDTCAGLPVLRGWGDHFLLVLRKV